MLNRILPLGVALALVLATLLCSLPARARVLPVSSDKELGIAVEVAEAEDFIIIQPGHYTWPHDHLLRAGALLSGATGNPEDVIISLGVLNSRLTDPPAIGDSGKVWFKDLTLTQYHSSGAMILTHCFLLLENCRFTQNVAESVAQSAGPLEIRNCRFQDNLTDCLLSGQDDMLIRDSLFTKNTNPVLVEMLAGRLTMTDCALTGNTGDLLQLNGAGGLCEDCVITGNSGEVGIHVPISLPYAQLDMNRCTIRENDFQQGALALEICAGTFDRCEILDNQALDGQCLLAPELTFRCCTLDLDAWSLANGEPVIDNEDCETADEALSLDGVKAMFR